MGLVLRRDGRFVHEGVLVRHAKLHAAFLKGVRFVEEEGVFIVQIGHFRAQIEVEDTPFESGRRRRSRSTSPYGPKQSLEATSPNVQE